MHSHLGLLLAVFLACAPLLEAEVSGQLDPGLVVSAAVEEILGAEPRSMSTVVFRVLNESDSPRRFLPVAAVPPGWKLISPLVPMELEPGEADIVLVSFVVPQAAVAGVYAVRLEVRSSDTSELLTSAETRLRVATVLGMDLGVAGQPPVVIAGDAYESRFLLTNQSNVALSFELQVESSLSFRYAIQSKTLELAAGQTAEVVVEVSTPQDLAHPARHVLKLTAWAPDHADLSAQAATAVEVLPFSTVESTWHKFPLTIEVEGACDTASEEGPLWGSVALSGRGTLDDRGRHNLALKIQPPALSAAEYAPAEGSYSLEYWNEHGGMAAGDRHYSLSPLTTGSVSESGVQGYLTAGGFELGGLWIEESAGLYLDREFDRDNSIELAWLCKPDSGVGSLIGVNGFFRPYDLVNIDFEAVVGTRGSRNYACSLKLDGRHPRLAYVLDILRAGENYQGAVQDVESFGGLATVDPIEDLRFTGRFQVERHNLAMDTSEDSILSNRQAGLGVAWKPLAGVDLSVAWNGTFRRDYLASNNLNTRDDTTTIAAGWTNRNLRLRLDADLYAHRDFASQAECRKQLFGLSASYKPTRNLSVDALVRVDTGLKAPGLTDSRSHFSLGGSYAHRKRTTFRAAYEMDYCFSSALSGSDRFSMGIRHQFEGSGRLDLSGGFTLNHDPSLDDAFEVAVTGTIPLDLPVTRRSDIGSVRGRIINQETGAGIAGVILSVNGSTTITDGNGEFYLPAEPVGTTYLRINPIRIDPALIPIQTMPMSITVERHRETSVEIGMARAAELAGRILRYEVDPAGTGILYPDATPAYKPEAGVAGMILEASGPGGARRALTDEEGRFAFPTLVPGLWVLKVVEDRIPDGYVIETSTFTVELRPGGRELVQIDMIPKARIMRILEEREIGE